MAVPAILRRRVVTRARHRCEYCGLSHLGQAATFHLDHVVPIAAGGATVFANLKRAGLAMLEKTNPEALT